MTASRGAAPVIRVRGLTKRYGDVKAVDRASRIVP